MALTEAETLRLAELEAKYAPKASKLTATEQARLDELEAKYAPPPPEEPGLGMKALHLVGQGLDYGSGLGRTAAGGLAELATGEDVIQEGDVSRAFHGNAVPGEELLKRTGIPEGAHVDLMPEIPIPFTDVTLGKGDSSMRDIGGFALEAGVDPLTYLTLGGAGAIKNALKGGTSAISKVGTKAASALERSLALPAKAVEVGGTKMYKSGLKRIDLEAAKYGKDPVSDVLLREGVYGSAAKVQKQMDELGEKLLEHRNNILKKATQTAGTDVSMTRAMAPIRSEIQKMRASGDPELIGLANVYDKRAQKYLNLEAKPEEDILRQLPTSKKEIQPEFREVKGYQPAKDELLQLPIQSEYRGPYREVTTPRGPDAGGLPVGQVAPLADNGWRRQILEGDIEMGQLRPASYTQRPPEIGIVQEPPKVIYGREIPAQERYVPGKPETVIDKSEATMGPSPIQASGYKTRIAKKIPKRAWENPGLLPEAQKLNKKMEYGLRKETEAAVGRGLGKEAELDLMNTNADLGKILTTKEKQAMDAAIESKKNMITSVDVPLGILGGKWALLGKKIADFAKLTGPRTDVGLALNRAGRAPIRGGAINVLSQRSLTNSIRPAYASPWTQMTPEEKKRLGR